MAQFAAQHVKPIAAPIDYFALVALFARWSRSNEQAGQDIDRDVEEMRRRLLTALHLPTAATA